MDEMRTLVGVFRRLVGWHERVGRVVDPVTGLPEELANPHPPLLLELERIITESRSTAVRAVLRGSSVPLNSDADKLAREIRATLRDFTNGSRFRFEPTLAHTAVEWFRAWSQYERQPAEIAVWVETLAGWENAILCLINRPVVMDARGGEPCPICGQSRVLDGDESKIALRIQFMPDDPAGTCELVCRNCESVAQGVHAVRAALGIRKIGA